MIAMTRIRVNSSTMTNNVYEKYTIQMIHNTTTATGTHIRSFRIIFKTHFNRITKERNSKFVMLLQQFVLILGLFLVTLYQDLTCKIKNDKILMLISEAHILHLTDQSSIL